MEIGGLFDFFFLFWVLAGWILDMSYGFSDFSQNAQMVVVLVKGVGRRETPACCFSPFVLALLFYLPIPDDHHPTSITHSLTPNRHVIRLALPP